MAFHFRSLASLGFWGALGLACSAGGDPGGSAGSAGNSGSSGGSAAGGSSGSGGFVTGSGGSSGGINVDGGGGSDDPDCDNILEVTFRDFNETHPDFEMLFMGDVVRMQLVEAALGADSKPVFKDSIGCAPADNDPTVCHMYYFPDKPVITSAETFNQWYRTDPAVNIELPKTLELTDNGAGQLVYDSTMFFPLGPNEGYGVSPANHDMMQNFLFTTEIHVRFTYRAGQAFTFRGDDDLWIFVNGKLALDLGSLHNAEEGTIDFDAQAATLGIVPGGVYPMDIFHAERHTRASNFRFSTNIACFVPGVIE